MRLEKTKLWTRALHPRSFSKGQTYVPSPISHHHPISLLQSAKPTSMHLSIKLPDIQAMQSKKLTSQDSNKAFLELHKWYIKITTKLFMNFWAFVWFSTIICQFSDPIITLGLKDSFFFIQYMHVLGVFCWFLFTAVSIWCNAHFVLREWIKNLGMSHIFYQ